MANFEVKLNDGTVEIIEGADAHQPDGQFTTFFALEEGRSRGLLERAHGKHP